MGVCSLVSNHWAKLQGICFALYVLCKCITRLLVQDGVVSNTFSKLEKKRGKNGNVCGLTPAAQTTQSSLKAREKD